MSGEGTTPKRPLTEEETIEERRKRRQAILAKHHGVVPPMHPPSSSLSSASPTPYPDDTKHSTAPVMPASPNQDDPSDMFSEHFEEKEEKRPTIPIGPQVALDSWDDAEGYYCTYNGELIHGRYEVKATLGRGIFGNVVRATDRFRGIDVAVKIIRRNMHPSGLKELGFLEKCMRADPEGRRHVIRLLNHFEYRNHLCLVVELLSVNLRDLLKKFGKNVGIHIKAVRIYATQMFHALSLFYKCRMIHADIKPDNILVSSNHLIIKICDLGTAISLDEFTEQQARTPYLVSRYYRAPEIVLGLPYDYGIDMWSVGCTLYELYTGRILFPGRNNHEMLKYMMDYKGKLPHKLLRKGVETGKYFDENDNFAFIHKYRDALTDKETVIKMNITHPVKDIKASLLSALSGVSHHANELDMISQFADLLEKCFILNPEKRISWKEAAKHPFIQGRSVSSN